MWGGGGGLNRRWRIREVRWNLAYSPESGEGWWVAIQREIVRRCLSGKGAGGERYHVFSLR